MKKLLLALTLCTSLLSASQWSGELRLGYFWPSSNLIRELYPSGGLEGEAQLNFRFRYNWETFANVAYFQKEGRSSGQADVTKLRLTPLSFGINYLFLPDCRCCPYLGFGANYTFFSNDNHTAPFIEEHASNSGWGWVGKSGLYIQLPNCFYADLFVDYHYNRLHFKGTGAHGATKVQVGGIHTGLGLGYHF